MLAFPVRQLRRMCAGPRHEDRAVHGGLGGDRHRGQCEGVGQHHRDPRIAAGHLLLATDPHQPPLTRRFGDRERRTQPHPLPGRRERPGQPRHHRHLQHRLVRRQQVHRARVGVHLVHHRGQREGQHGAADRRPGGCRRLRGRLPVGHADHLLARPRDLAQEQISPLAARRARRAPPETAAGYRRSHCAASSKAPTYPRPRHSCRRSRSAGRRMGAMRAPPRTAMAGSSRPRRVTIKNNGERAQEDNRTYGEPRGWQ